MKLTIPILPAAHTSGFNWWGSSNRILLRVTENPPTNPIDSRLSNKNNDITQGSNNFPVYLVQVQCLRMADNPKNNRGFTQQSPLQPSSQMFRPFVTKSHRHAQDTQQPCMYAGMCTQKPRIHTLAHTLPVSKCHRSIWIAVVITVKAGHPRDARLTLLTCLHQHTWTASVAAQQFSHGTSQNKVRCSHTLQRPRLLLDTQCVFVVPTQRGAKSCMLFSWNQKTPESRWKPLFPIDFTC